MNEVTRYLFLAPVSAVENKETIEQWEEDFVRIIGWGLKDEGWYESGRIYFYWTKNEELGLWEVKAERFLPEPWTGRWDTAEGYDEWPWPIEQDELNDYEYDLQGFDELLAEVEELIHDTTRESAEATAKATGTTA